MDTDAASGAPADGADGAEDPVTALRRRAIALVGAADPDGAEGVIDELVVLAATTGRADVDAWVHLLRAHVAAARGRGDDAGSLAARACAELLAPGPTAVGALGLAQLGRLLDQLNRFDEAVESLAIAAFFADQLTESSPLLVEACSELAAVFGDLEVFDVAYRHAERAYVVTLPAGDQAATIDRCVDLATIAARFAHELDRSGDTDAGHFVERARQAAALGLRLVDAHGGTDAHRRALRLALGDALVTAGEPAEALAVLEPALADVPQHDLSGRAAALTALGRACGAAGDPIRAIEHLTAAVAAFDDPAAGPRPPGTAASPELVAALLALAAAQATVGRTNAAYASLRRVLDAEQATQRHRRRRVAEVLGDRLRVVTDEHALTRRGRTFSTDPVTGLADRRHVEAALEELAKRWAGQEVAVVLVDVHHLDDVRQRYGDVVADDVLRRLAGLLRARQRNDDVAARWDDACFLLLLPRCPAPAADQVAARVRAAVGAVPWSELAFGLTVVASTGTASAVAPFDLDALVMQAGTGLAVARVLHSTGT